MPTTTLLPLRYPLAAAITSLGALTGFAEETEPSADPGSAYFQAGEKVYMTVCFGCHQPHGNGVPGAFPPLAGSEWVGGDPARMAKIVLHGMRGPIEVAGQSFNSEMPPQGPLLDDIQLAQVLTYVRNAWGNRGTPVAPAEVSALRKEFAARTGYWDAEALAAAHPLDGSPPAAGEAAPGNDGIQNLKWAVFEGDWPRLPDFDRMEPVATGTLEGGKVSIAKTRKKAPKERFGIRFSGELTVPQDGEYTFFLGSDDGSKLWVGGEVVVDNDGVHGMGEKNGKVRLRQGRHPVRVDYFERSGDEALYLGWSGPGFRERALSDRGKNQPGRPPTGMPLGPDGMVARIYRNFIEGAGARAIGVGYPGHINLAWDANNMRPAMIWRGPFIDAARHWNGRGAGFQPPLNTNYILLPEGVPFARLESQDATWPTHDERPPDRLRTSAFVFRGYSLDGNGWPTFRYRFGDVDITDRFAPRPAAGQPLDQMATDTFQRTLTVQGNGAAGPTLYHRLARGDLAAGPGGSVGVGGRHRVRLLNRDDPALKPLLRQSGGQPEFLVAVRPSDAPVVIETEITFLD